MTNAEIIRFFTEEVFNKGRAELIDQYVLPNYKQHNPTVEQGREGFRKFHQRFRSTHPNLHLHIMHLYSDGDVVVSHNWAELESGKVEAVVVDIYRLENGMLAEHWDCIQRLTPEQIPNREKLF